MNDRFLVLAIAALALIDGILHLALVLFPLVRQGRFFFNELTVLFVLNFVAYIVLGGALLFGRRMLGSRLWLVNLALGLVAAVSIVMWLQRHGPNPLGLGYPSKAIEVLLVVAVAAHFWLTQRNQTGSPQRLSA
jgi:hypothetical protein